MKQIRIAESIEQRIGGPIVSEINTAKRMLPGERSSLTVRILFNDLPGIMSSKIRLTSCHAADERLDVSKDAEWLMKRECIEM